MSDLHQQIALVTGGGRGIGRAIAIAFARAGADVALAARSADQIDRTAAEIETLGRKAIAIVTDVTDPDQVQGLAESVQETFGRLDILVN
ncbi:MAG: SDR family NAD(P)-dependent oxidoreductase, partial [bacterium]|nr:SDR family NAD(P)-dependent oxidoreductase [bacterium]